MNQEFTYSFGQKVALPSGIIGTVEGNSVISNAVFPRVLVHYSDSNGVFREEWIDENKLSAVAE